MSSTSLTPLEDAQRRLRDLLAELRAEAEKATSERSYHEFWLRSMSEVMCAVSGETIAQTENGRWTSTCVCGVPSDGEEANQFRIAALQKISSTRHYYLQDELSRTSITFPVVAVGQLHAAVRFDVDFETDAAKQGCVKFIGDAIETLERFYLLYDRRQALERLSTVDVERKLSDAVHRDLHLDSTALTLVNEGRRLIGCDRLSVLLRRGANYRLTAVSGQESVNRRTSAAHGLEAVACACGATGEVVVFPDSVELAAGLIQVLEDYVDENHAKRIVVAPLRAPSNVQQTDAWTVEPPRPLGAVVVEYFGETAHGPDESRLVEIVSRCGAAALNNAAMYDGLFLGRLWQFLGRWRAAALEPGSRRRTLFILGAVVAGIISLATVPKEFTAYCRGTIIPAERRHVFAPLDGTVERVAVKHGDRVSKGQLLVELRNTDLDIAMADVAGRRTATAEQLSGVDRTLFDEGRRITAEERARLSGERSQLREELASLDRQLKLYAEKREQLSIVSPIDGEVTTWDTEDLLENRPVRVGQQLLTVVAAEGQWELELRLPDDRSGRVVDAARRSTQPLTVTYSPAVDPGLTRTGQVIEIEKSAELRDEDGNTVLVRVAINSDDLPQRRPGAEVAANIHCGTQSLGYVWLHDVIGFIRGRILFRWF